MGCFPSAECPGLRAESSLQQLIGLAASVAHEVKNPMVGIVGFAQFMSRCVTHWHFYKFTREAIAGRLRAYNTI